MESSSINRKMSHETMDYSLQSIKFLNPDVKNLDCESDGLLDFDVQTTLEAFIDPKILN
jgi:hypothetical protein